MTAWIMQDTVRSEHTSSVRDDGSDPPIPKCSYTRTSRQVSRAASCCRYVTFMRVENAWYLLGSGINSWCAICNISYIKVRDTKSPICQTIPWNLLCISFWGVFSTAIIKQLNNSMEPSPWKSNSHSASPKIPPPFFETRSLITTFTRALH